ncbi:MAG TPA: apolipoprotein N-acyltransferase [Candidatus Eisenbacteria bacterium]|nr:apolipoprotein N-acyltransferase [Candidatus Eisenbacteria bacterium]
MSGPAVLIGSNGAAQVAVAEGAPPGLRWRNALAIVSGLALAAAFPSFDVEPLAWIGFVPLLQAIRGQTPARAFRLGWLTGFVFYLATTYWVGYTIVHYTNVPLVIAMAIVVLMASALACYHGAFAAGIRFFERGGRDAVWLAPALWVTLEWMRGWFFIGFPWGALGYSQYRFHDLVQIAELTGVYGVSAVLVLFNVVVANVLRERGTSVRRQLPALLTVTVLLVVLPALGHWRIGTLAREPITGTLRVGLAQGNVEQDQKWDPAFQDETMARYEVLTLDATRDGARLVVWPETAAPFFFQNPSDLREGVLGLARRTRTPLLIGTPAYEQTGTGRMQQRNRAYLVAPSGEEAGYYDKIQLVPFGEYVPLARLLFFVKQIVTAVGTIGAGENATVFRVPEGKFGVLICYEGVFPALTRRFVDGGADFLVNITNDAWYGRTSAPYQHLVQASFRAIENRVPLVRAANTGISAIIDPDGRIRWQGPLYEMLWHVDDIRWTGTRTFYTRFGDVFVWLCAIVTVLGLVTTAARKPS